MGDYNNIAESLGFYKEPQTIDPQYTYWYPDYYPYENYKPLDNSGTINFRWYLPTTISPSGEQYERKDLPVIELQLKDQCGYTVIKKVDKIVFSGDGFLNIYYKEGRQKKTMMIPESNILAMHKTGWK